MRTLSRIFRVLESDDYFDADPKTPDHTHGKTGGFPGSANNPTFRYFTAGSRSNGYDQLLGMAVEKALENVDTAKIETLIEIAQAVF